MKSFFFDEENANKHSIEGIFWVEEKVDDMDCYLDKLNKLQVLVNNDYNHIKKLLRDMA